jgi:hypothetical protein
VISNAVGIVRVAAPVLAPGEGARAATEGGAIHLTVGNGATNALRVPVPRIATVGVVLVAFAVAAKALACTTYQPRRQGD